MIRGYVAWRNGRITDPRPGKVVARAKHYVTRHWGPHTGRPPHPVTSHHSR